MAEADPQDPIDPAEDPVDPVDPAAGTDPADEKLREPGLRALEAERTARKNAESELRDLKAAAMSDSEKAIEEARAAGESEASARYQKQIATLATTNAAAGKFASPALAAKFVDEVPVSEDGTVNETALAALIDDVLKAHPELGIQSSGAPKVPAGARGTESAPDMNDLFRRAAGR